MGKFELDATPEMARKLIKLSNLYSDIVISDDIRDLAKQNLVTKEEIINFNQLFCTNIDIYELETIQQLLDSNICGMLHKGKIGYTDTFRYMILFSAIKLNAFPLVIYGKHRTWWKSIIEKSSYSFSESRDNIADVNFFNSSYFKNNLWKNNYIDNVKNGALLVETSGHHADIPHLLQFSRKFIIGDAPSQQVPSYPRSDATDLDELCHIFPNISKDVFRYNNSGYYSSFSANNDPKDRKQYANRVDICNTLFDIISY